jgi:ubiquinone/menaquinone biosynthesis C-methylase UbiE
MAKCRRICCLLCNNSRRLCRGGLCLDLGCGTGRDLAWLTSQQLRVCGADFSVGMLAEARKIVTCPLAQMDMRALGFADNTFDGLWCNAALLHLPKLEAPRALQEMRRVLRKDGWLGVAVQQGASEGLELNPYTQAGERFFARYSMTEMTQLLSINGFIVMKALTEATPQRTWLRFMAQVVR